MKKILILLLIPSFSWALDIASWQPRVAEEGYILSVDMESEGCDKIWSEKIPLFLKKNPEVKNPDLIFVGQTLEVPSCLPVPHMMEMPKSVSSKEDDSIRLRSFISVYGGLSFLGEDKGDTKKQGHNIGVKVGYELLVPHQMALAVAVGYLRNQSKTVGSNSLGEYEVETNMMKLEAHYNKYISSTLRLGGLINLVASKDVSIRDQERSEPLGVYAGAEALYRLTSSWDLETNLQQRIDQLDRSNLFLNLGMKYNF